MREGIMDDCGYHGFEECFRYEDCCKDAYEQGRIDVIDEIKIEYKRMFNCGYTDCVTCDAYCNARKFMDKLEQMKEQNK